MTGRLSQMEGMVCAKARRQEWVWGMRKPVEQKEEEGEGH